MKKMTMLRSIATVGLLTVFGMGAFAQFLPSGLPTAKVIPADTISLADTVSVGAKMPYYVRPDAVISHSTLYNPSGFAWDFNGGGSASLLNASGAALGVSPVGATYATDTLVMATMPAAAGVINLKVTERSNPKFSATAGCAGNQRTLGINVIDLPLKPTIANADTAQGGCSASAPYAVKYNFTTSTAKFPAYIQVTLKTYDVTGAAIGTPTTTWYQINKTSDNIVIAQADLNTAAGGTFVTGRAEVSLGNLYDRISLIDSNYKIGAATFTNSLAVDASVVQKAAIMVLPTPNTGVISHIKTL